MATKLSGAKPIVRTTSASARPPASKPVAGGGGRQVPIFTALPGVRDLLPRDTRVWRAVESAIAAVGDLHQCFPIDPPAIESADMYEAVLATNDVPYAVRPPVRPAQVSPERAEGAPTRVVPQLDPRVGVLRAVLEHHVGGPSSPLKLSYSGWRIGPELAGEPDATCVRVRGFEFIGDTDPLYDGEAIAAAVDVFRLLKIPDLKLVINTLGCRVCRSNYQQKLGTYYRGVRAKLCRDCAKRVDTSPLALFACEHESCREERGKAPILLDYLCQNCNNHFRSVLEFVEEGKMLYEPNPYLVGPAPYHTRTVFEIVSGGGADAVSAASGGNQSDSRLPLAAGGRYDYLGEVLRTKLVPAMGVTLYLERIIAALRGKETPVLPAQFRQSSERPAVFFVAVGDQARKSSLRLMQLLRAGGVPVAESVGKKSLKAQFRVAEKLRSEVALLFGQREAFEGTVIVRDLKTGAQETVLAANIVAETKKRFK